MPARQRFCRVCGQPFRTTRLDAETCSTTCRTRRRRGGDLAYLSSLPADQAQARRFVHEAHRDLIVTTKAVAKSRQEGRGQRRKLPKVTGIRTVSRVPKLVLTPDKGTSV